MIQRTARAAAMVLALGPHAAVAAPSGSVTLEAGLNLAAPPVDPAVVPDGATLIRLLGDPTRIARISRYDPVAGAFDSVAYDQHGNVVGNFPVLAGEGWVVHGRSTSTYDFAGPPGCAATRLERGFNLVGFPCGAGLDAHALLEQLGGPAVVASVQRFDPVGGRLESAGYENGQPAGAQFPVVPGVGYVVNALRPTTIEVRGSDGPEVSPREAPVLSASVGVRVGGRGSLVGTRVGVNVGGRVALAGASVGVSVGGRNPRPGVAVGVNVGGRNRWPGTQVGVSVGGRFPALSAEVGVNVGGRQAMPGASVGVNRGGRRPLVAPGVGVHVGGRNPFVGPQVGVEVGEQP